ncbi:hypothetical protein LZ198_25145 [Myxococcus sp. K15C18031901]|uniref:hypothetical protein n=1 Tax=Myxococcus dinghuensis TaxID=2906761 RepID=UPI0020A82D6A|nr:hypothetical protein [Myxococcus dinghuensis]MCP3102159.1 hypothetical protein [Myxococcus dinghuensis]
MRRVVFVVLALAVVPLACKTTQPAGAEQQEPLQGPDQVREPVQTVTDDPPGPATPLPAELDGGTPDAE